MLSLRRLLGAFFVAALLAAQQAALQHPLWHVAAAPEQSPLCELHDALGTMTSAIDCAVPAHVTEAPAATIIAAVLPAAHAGAPLAPSSRGPPTLL